MEAPPFSAESIVEMLRQAGLNSFATVLSRHNRLLKMLDEGKINLMMVPTDKTIAEFLSLVPGKELSALYLTELGKELVENHFSSEYRETAFNILSVNGQALNMTPYHIQTNYRPLAKVQLGSIVAYVITSFIVTQQQLERWRTRSPGFKSLAGGNNQAVQLIIEQGGIRGKDLIALCNTNTEMAEYCDRKDISTGQTIFDKLLFQEFGLPFDPARYPPPALPFGNLPAPKTQTPRDLYIEYHRTKVWFSDVPPPPAVVAAGFASREPLPATVKTKQFNVSTPTSPMMVDYIRHPDLDDFQKILYNGYLLVGLAKDGKIYVMGDSLVGSRSRHFRVPRIDHYLTADGKITNIGLAKKDVIMLTEKNIILTWRDTEMGPGTISRYVPLYPVEDLVGQLLALRTSPEEIQVGYIHNIGRGEEFNVSKTFSIVGKFSFLEEPSFDRGISYLEVITRADGKQHCSVRAGLAGFDSWQFPHGPFSFSPKKIKVVQHRIPWKTEPTMAFGILNKAGELYLGSLRKVGDRSLSWVRVPATQKLLDYRLQNMSQEVDIIITTLNELGEVKMLSFLLHDDPAFQTTELEKTIMVIPGLQKVPSLLRTPPSYLEIMGL